MRPSALAVRLIVGHSHSFDRPILRARELIATEALGAVRMIQAQYNTDFLYRPRRPEELVTAQGGGVVFSQGAHQVDIVRLLGGGRVRSVRALTGAWDASRPTEGAYAALLTFEEGALAALSYSGYGHFDGDEFCGGLTELGRPSLQALTARHVGTWPRLGDGLDETALKARRNYGGANYPPSTESACGEPASRSGVARTFRHGPRVVRPWRSTAAANRCDDLRRQRSAHGPAPTSRRSRAAEVIDELYAAMVGGEPPLHDGRWAMATLEVCLAMLQSAREGRDVVLSHQVGVR